MDQIYKRMENDRFAKLCGMEIEEIREGYGRASMTVDDRHLNGLDITQGGVIFTLADFAFACAANSHGPVTVSITVSMSFLKAAEAGDKLVAEAREISLSRKLAVYEMDVSNGTDLVAKMTGTVYRRTQNKPR